MRVIKVARYLEMKYAGWFSGPHDARIEALEAVYGKSDPGEIGRDDFITVSQAIIVANSLGGNFNMNLLKSIKGAWGGVLNFGESAMADKDQAMTALKQLVTTLIDFFESIND